MFPNFNMTPYGYGAAPRQAQRLDMMQQQYQQNYQQPYGSMQQQASYLNGRPVTSIEEARAAQIPLDGSATYFPAPAEGKIYVKSIDLNGTPVFQTYVMEQPQQQPVYAPSNELEELRNRVAKLEAKLGGNNNVQPDAVNANDANS